MDKERALKTLEKIIKKSRIHFYKPIQIAEILYHDRIFHDIDLSSLETYRNRSKKWRDDMSMLLLGRVCTSSARFQDNLFDDNAIPPAVLEVLGKINRETGGSVEEHIYSQFLNRHSQLRRALDYCRTASPENFDVKSFIYSFTYEPGLKRSLDKIYEIIVYALFSALSEVMNVQIHISIDSSKIKILEVFRDFAERVMRINPFCPVHSETAKIFRAGVTNAADRGIDMYSSWGAVIQVKHLSIDEELAEDITDSISSDRIIIVCRDADKSIILSLLTQIGWRSHIQSIITENDLVSWYSKALRGKYSAIVGAKVLLKLREEISREFPPANDIPDALKSRQYKLHAY